MIEKKIPEWTIMVKVDTNDADYVTVINTITQENLEIIAPLIRAIAAKNKEMQGKWFHNFEHLDFTPSDAFNPKELYPGVSDDAFEILRDYCPYDQDGFHSIESIQIAPRITWTTVL